MAPSTAKVLAAKLAADNPTRSFHDTADGATVGVTMPDDGPIMALMSLTLLGTWTASPRVHVNGQPIQRTWIALS